MLGLLQISASEGQSTIVESQQSSTCIVGMGLGLIDEQTGTNDGQFTSRGSQHASGGIEGSPVPPPGGQRGTKSGQRNLAGSQHAPSGNEGIGLLDALCVGHTGTVESAHCMRDGSQQADEGRVVMEAEAEGQIGAPVGQSIFVGSQQSIGGNGCIDGRPDIDAVDEGQAQSIRFGSQQGTAFCVGFALGDPEKEGRRVYADVMEAEGQIMDEAAQFIVVGSQHPPLPVPVLPVLLLLLLLPAESFAVILGDCVGREVEMEVIEAEGQITVSDGQFVVMGSQQEPVGDLGVGVGLIDGQIGIAGSHCILVGSQHPLSKGVALEETSREIGEGEGDGYA
jgi:hypothetical protein